MKAKIIFLFLISLIFISQGITFAQTLGKEEVSFLNEINKYRVSHGVAPLKLSRALTNAAKWMSSHLAQDISFSHTDSYGNDPFDRMEIFGYDYETWEGENIAAGNSSAHETFLQWKNSPDHNENMLDPNYKVIGISRVRQPGSLYVYYWTTDFGGYEDETIELPANQAKLSASKISS